MAKISQLEIDEISEAFKEAWHDFFGDVCYYVQFDDFTEPHPIYKENKRKQYKYGDKKKFHATVKEIQSMNESHPAGFRNIKYFELTFVTKELVDQGITHVDPMDLITYTDRFGREFCLKMSDEFQKVQMTSNKIFTKVIVRVDG